MGLGFAKHRASPIAIDFGVDHIKLLQISTGDAPQSIAATSVRVPESARSDIGSRNAFLAEALPKAISEHGFKGKRVSCATPAFQSLIQNLQVTGEAGDLDKLVNQQLLERFSIDAGRMVVRSLPVETGGGSKHEVVCFAVRRGTVMGYVKLLKQVKLDVVGMQSEPVAIVSAFRHLYRRASDAQRTTVFIDIGAATTKIVVTHGADIVFAKTIHAAGDHFTQQYAEANGLDIEEARRARIEMAAGGDDTVAVDSPSPDAAPQAQHALGDRRGAPPSGFAMIDSQMAAAAVAEAPVAVAETDPAPVAAAAADPPSCFAGDAYDCLLDELTMCLRYYQSTFTDRTVEKLVFLGGESRHVELCQKLARSLKIAAQLGDPLARLGRDSGGNTIGLDLRQPQPGWAVPMGLCLCPSIE